MLFSFGRKFVRPEQPLGIPLGPICTERKRTRIFSKNLQLLNVNSDMQIMTMNTHINYKFFVKFTSLVEMNVKHGVTQ